MVPIKNYFAQVTPVDQLPISGGANDGVRGNPQPSGETLGCYCYYQQMSSGEAYATFGIVLTNPAIIQCEVEDAAIFTPDAEVTIQGGNMVYRVVGDPNVYNDGLDPDHADVTLEFKMYPLLG